MNELYISILRREVEKRASMRPVSTEDFSSLSRLVEEAVGERLSVSTLKRTWARVRDDYSRRPSTLSILSRYIGYAGWQDFLIRTRDNLREESDFKPMNAVDLESLPANTLVMVSWMPDRSVRLLHTAGRNFTVLESVNSKLTAGDKVEISMLAPGEPMFISKVIRGDKAYDGYVAGQIHGVTFSIL